MIIRALDYNDDWMFGKGLSSYNFENKAIVENVVTRIKSWLNDCWFDMGAGIDWPRLLGTRGTKTEIALTARAVILQSYGVVKCSNIDPVMDGRKMTLIFNIDTIYATGLVGEVTI